METIDFLNPWRATTNISPVLKLVAMICMLAIRDKANTVIVSRKRGSRIKLLYTPEGHGECEMVPPPTHLCPLIIQTFRRLGRLAAKNPASAFSFSYTDSSHEKKLVWLTQYGNQDDAKTELNNLLLKLHVEEEVEAKLEKIHRSHKARIKRLAWLGVSLMTLVIITTAIAWWFS